MNLQNMAPNAKRSMLISLGFGLLAVCIYLAAVEPAISQRDATARSLSELKAKHEIMSRNLASAEKINERTSDLEARLAPYREAMLEPLLESLAMRAKSIVDPIALGAGLVDTDYEELSAIALPVPKRLPLQLHARQPIRLTARGSYQSAISFLTRLEKEFPLVTLEALEITAQQDPAAQKIEMILEWPVKGKSTKIEPPKKGAKK